VLNTPSLVYQLRNIAIKEFSVENVLFWENYNVLKSLVTRYFIEYKKAEEMGNVDLLEQYDFDGYYHQQIQSYSRSSLDSYSYDSKIQVPKKIVPYYDRFYNTYVVFFFFLVFIVIKNNYYYLLLFIILYYSL